jgi:amino acid transporter
MTTDGPAAGDPADEAATGAVTVTSATAIGVGGMMGAGLYTLVGLASTTAGVWLPVAFLVGAFVAAFSVYSYAKLGAAFPSRGGAAQFLVEGFGDGVLAGGLNVFQFIGWVIAMALYASGFAGYALDLLPDSWPSWSGKLIALGLLVLVVAVNLVGTKLVGRAELYVIAVELAILVTFIVLGLTKSHFHHFDATGGSGFLGVLFAAGLLYVTFEGFGVVTNSAAEMRDPARQLPRAMYGSLAIVTSVYVLVSVVVVATLSLAAIDANQGHVLAEVGRALAGRIGFVAIGAAALLATASGVNAALFGDANLAFQMAKDGELPEAFSRKVWHGGPGSRFIAAGLTGLFVVAFPLSAVGQMASLAFLIVYGSVSVGHLRIRAKTGAKAGLLVAAVALNAALFALLLEHAIATGPATTWITLLGTLAFSFVFAAVYRRRRRIRAAPTDHSPVP